MKSECWRHMGEIFRTMTEQSPTLRSSVISKHPELQPYIDQPLQCIEKAMELTPRNPQLMTRFALLVRFDDVDRSLRLLKDSIEIDSSCGNRFAFTVRGDIYLKTYRNQIRTNEHSGRTDNTLPDRNLLRLAQEDFEKALSFNLTPKDLSSFACVWHYRSKNRDGKLSLSKEGEDCIMKALAYHTKAVNCENGSMRQDINHHRGTCLLDAKEYDAAIESFKRAMECQAKTNMNTTNFYLLVKGYLTKLSELRVEEGSYLSPVFSELAYWCKEAVTKYGVETLKSKVSYRLWNITPRKWKSLFLIANQSVIQ